MEHDPLFLEMFDGQIAIPKPPTRVPKIPLVDDLWSPPTTRCADAELQALTDDAFASVVTGLTPEEFRKIVGHAVPFRKLACAVSRSSLRPGTLKILSRFVDTLKSRGYVFDDLYEHVAKVGISVDAFIDQAASAE